MKKLFSALLCAALLLSLALVVVSCGTPPCETHKDDDKNGICDVCSAEVEIVCDEHKDADNNKVCDVCKKRIEEPKPVEVTVAFTIKDQEGAVVPGVEVVLQGAGNKGYNATADENGAFSLKLPVGTYRAEYDNYASDDVYYYPETTSVTVAADTTSIEIKFYNNTPNGTTDRPFPLSAGEENALTVPAGSGYYYIVYRAINYIVSIEGAGVKVIYAEKEYTPDADGKIGFELLGDSSNSTEVLYIESTTDSDAEISLMISSKPGTSMDNPFAVESLGTEITSEAMEPKTNVYYEFVATKDGTLELTVTTDKSYASLNNMTSGMSSNTDEEKTNVITVAVSEGDRIIIECATQNFTASDVSFILDYVEMIDA
ncbi:MAG: carboxypeptidase regulatory-like domain-containing protein [Clostridia bacterium]|nr:carboxypeptidase regulatory-like domain-containing protein [Clostridia bacterium]